MDNYKLKYLQIKLKYINTKNKVQQFGAGGKCGKESCKENPRTEYGPKEWEPEGVRIQLHFYTTIQCPRGVIEDKISIYAYSNMTTNQILYDYFEELIKRYNSKDIDYGEFYNDIVIEFAGVILDENLTLNEQGIENNAIINISYPWEQYYKIVIDPSTRLPGASKGGYLYLYELQQLNTIILCETKPILIILNNTRFHDLNTTDKPTTEKILISAQDSYTGLSLINSVIIVQYNNDNLIKMPQMNNTMMWLTQNNLITNHVNLIYIDNDLEIEVRNIGNRVSSLLRTKALGYDNRLEKDWFFDITIEEIFKLFYDKRIFNLTRSNLSSGIVKDILSNFIYIRNIDQLNKLNEKIRLIKSEKHNLPYTDGRDKEIEKNDTIKSIFPNEVRFFVNEQEGVYILYFDWVKLPRIIYKIKK